MAGVTPSQFRLGPDTLADLDALAASNGGQRTTAVKEAAAQFRALVDDAGRANADELSRDEWVMLGHLNDPDPFAGLDLGDGPEPSYARDWSAYLAQELATIHDGRPVPLLESQKDELRAAQKLARKIRQWGRLRGFALMAALRHFWREPTAGIESCRAPEVWLTPTAKGKG